MFSALLFFPVSSAFCDTFIYSPVQSPNRPLGLDIVDKVGLAGSDEQSKEFLSINYDDYISVKSDSLILAEDFNIRAYFVGENTGYHNSLGFTLNEKTSLIFPDTSLPSNYYSSPNTRRTERFPLFPGDFVNLGNIEAGNKLDFFLVIKDKIADPNQMVCFAQAENPYIFINFDDRGKTDYNDVLIAIYVGEKNAQSILDNNTGENGIPAPEPGFIWLTVTCLGVWLSRKKSSLAVL